jgi:aspartate kinase
MALLVQKYGGSSVADTSRIGRVADRVARTRAAGHDVVVVVSAMGNTTNELLALARQVSRAPGRRELDMLISVGERVSMALLAIALEDRGVRARSFTGSQAGIVTDESHANARVLEVRPDRVREALAAGEVAIVAGFQGVSRAREVTTLGRGGSDTTAVVLAAALHADECEICSDVDGIWSADPRAVPAAVKLDALSLDEALALARNGAKVLYDEAVAWAHRSGIALRASATALEGGGTRVTPEVAVHARVVAVTADTQLGRIPLARLGELPTACVRHADGAGVLVDLRNLHAPVAGIDPAATVAVIGTRCGADPSVLGRILDAAAAWSPDDAGRVARWHATADAVVFDVPPPYAAALERTLHERLLENPS